MLSFSLSTFRPDYTMKDTTQTKKSLESVSSVIANLYWISC